MRSFCVFLLGVVGLSAVSGCRPHVAAPQAPVQALSPLEASVTHVQTHPLYIRARRFCMDNEYDKAVPLLRQLTLEKSFSAQERAFAEQQLAICLAHTFQVAPKVVPLSALMALDPPKPASHPATPEDADCGPRALLLVCRRVGVEADLPKLRRLAGTGKDGTSLAGLAEAAKKVGLRAEGVQVGRDALARVDMPALAWVNGNHFYAVLSTRGEGEGAEATIHDPNKAAEETISQERLLRECSGYLLLLKRR